MEVEDEEAKYCMMELSVPYSLTLNKAYDQLLFLERLVGVVYLGQISRSLMEMIVSSWLSTMNFSLVI